MGNLAEARLYTREELESTPAATAAIAQIAEQMMKIMDQRRSKAELLTHQTTSLDTSGDNSVETSGYADLAQRLLSLA